MFPLFHEMHDFPVPSFSSAREARPRGTTLTSGLDIGLLDGSCWLVSHCVIRECFIPVWVIEEEDDDIDDFDTIDFRFASTSMQVAFTP